MDFYRDLLFAEPTDDRVREAREAVSSFTRPVVPVHIQCSLLSPFSDVELEEAGHNLGLLYEAVRNPDTLSSLSSPRVLDQ